MGQHVSDGGTRLRNRGRVACDRLSERERAPLDALQVDVKVFVREAMSYSVSGVARHAGVHVRETEPALPDGAAFAKDDA